jgi:hypothetical protein
MRAFSRSLRMLVYSRPCAEVVILAVCIGVALIQSRATSISASVGALASRPCFGGGRAVFSDAISNDRARSAISPECSPASAFGASPKQIAATHIQRDQWPSLIPRQ